MGRRKAEVNVSAALQKVVGGHDGGSTMVFVRDEGLPLHVQLDQLLGEDLRCPQGISLHEWLRYFTQRLGDYGRRPQDYVLR
jgi:hypothetical protein